MERPASVLTFTPEVVAVLCFFHISNSINAVILYCHRILLESLSEEIRIIYASTWRNRALQSEKC